MKKWAKNFSQYLRYFFFNEGKMKKLAQLRVQEVIIPETYSLKKTGITQGLLADFVTCRQRFLFRINGYRLDQPPSEALFFGSLVHEILEHFYSETDFQIESIPDIIAAFVGSQDYPEDLILKAQALTEIYCKIYANERATITPVRTEETFAVEAFDVLLRGRKDLVYEISKTKKKWMREHKTKSHIDHEFLGYQLSHDLQNLFYDQSELLEYGSPFVGITYNILKRPQQRVKKSETGLEFLERLRNEILLNFSDFFFRYEVTFTQQDRERFKKELQAKLNEVTKYLKGDLGHYRNESACLLPYRCQFLEACTSGHMARYSKSNIIFPELEQ